MVTIRCIPRFGKVITLTFWYDKPHICRTDFYISFVFGQKHSSFKEDGTCAKMKVKNFIEDTLGNCMTSDIKENGYSAFMKYGAYVLNDSEDILVSHMRGRTFEIR